MTTIKSKLQSLSNKQSDLNSDLIWSFKITQGLIAEGLKVTMIHWNKCQQNIFKSSPESQMKWFYPYCSQIKYVSDGYWRIFSCPCVPYGTIIVHKLGYK
jgi:adenine specific DNA methylase Mod